MREQRIVKGNTIASGGARQVVQISDRSAEAFVRDGAANPIVECVKEGDVVRYIDIQCTCGQVTRLVCDYERDGLVSS